MNESKLINVGLYGDKPIRAEMIYCDRFDKCPFYKNKTCLNVTSRFSDYCKFGQLVSTKGPRTKCASRNTFEGKYRSLPEYHQLSHPGNFTLRLFDDYAVINLGRFTVEKRHFNSVEWVHTETYHINDGFGEHLSWVPIEDLTPELLERIFSHHASKLIGWEEDPIYKTTYLPNLCYDIKRYLPNLYADFIAKFPDYDLVPNHIGKYALLTTLNRDCTYKTNGSVFHWEGEYLVCEKFHTAFMPLNIHYGYLKIKPDNTTKYMITSNDQVTDATVFV